MKFAAKILAVQIIFVAAAFAQSAPTGLQSTSITYNSATLSWNSVTGASYYQVQVDHDGSFSTPDWTSGNVSALSTSTTSLSGGTKYYWRVRAGSAGQWSSGAANFTTIPTAPTLSSPSNSATSVAVSPTLDWNTSTGAATYRMQLSTVSTFSSTVVDDATLTSSSRPVGPLSNNATFYWRVSATNATGTSSYSSTWSFSTAPAAPTGLVVSSVTTSSASISWSSVVGATSYTIQLDTDSDFRSPLPDIIQSGTSVTKTSLSDGTRYYWRVKASSANGSSGWVQGTSFVTLVPAPTGKPNDLWHWHFGSYVLGWSRVDGADSYYVELYTDPSFSSASLVGGDTTSRHEGYTVIRNLSPGVTYYWRVRGVNGGGSGPWSTENDSFTLEPNPPILLSPSNGATGISTSPTLSWNASSGATSYTLQYSISSDFPSNPQSATTTVNSISGISQNVSGLSNSTRYYWHVKATNSGGTSNYSNAFSFTTSGAVNPPLAPTLSAPSNGVTGVTVTQTLSWSASSTASSYRLQVSTSSAMSSPVVDDSTLTGTSRSVGPLSNNTQYYWRVNAKNSGGTSAYSSVFSFTTIVAVPAAPSPATPANGATAVSISPTISWSAPVGATSYRLQVSTSSTFSTFVFDQSTLTSPSYTLVGLSNSIQYYWRVSASNAGGAGPFSSTYSFTTTLALPGAPSGLVATPTSNGAVLTWIAASGASWYLVEVNDPNFSLIWRDSTSSLSSSARNLSPATTYTWRVWGGNAAGPGTSVGGSFRTPIAVPSAPGDLIETPNATGASLSWALVSGATSYVVEVYTDNNLTTRVWKDSLTAPPATVTNLLSSRSYTWRVQAINSGGRGGWTMSTFTTSSSLPNPPSAPTLATPVNGGSDVPISTTLSWSASSGATIYRLQLSTSSTFSTTVVDDSSLSGISRLVGPLSNNTQYYWRVCASNAGGTSQYSPTWSFTTIVVAPPIPTLSSPANNAGDQPVTLTLNWNASQGATKYRVQLSTSTNFATSLVDDSTVTGTSLQAGPLSNNTQYFWRVKASNVGGSSGYSSVFAFKTIVSPPAAPVLVTPQNNAGSVSTSPTFTWIAPDSALSYTIQVSTVSDFSTFIITQSGITGGSYRAAALSNSTQYYWRVRATNVGGTGLHSSAFTFTTIVALPGAPTLTYPANNTSGVETTPTLEWAASAGATRYRLQLSTSSTFNSTILDDSTLVTPSRQVGPLSNSTTYYWRVSATNAGGTTAYSSAFSFTTIVAAPSTPTLSSPANGSTNVPINPTLSWNTATGATTYRLQVSSSQSFATSIVDEAALSTTSREVGPLSNNTTYYWRVSATNVGGTTAYSSVFSFTTIVAAPSASTLSSPANGSTNVPIDPTLSWNAATGATTYRIQVSASQSFATSIVDEAALTTTSRQVGPLSKSTTYYWRVSATNAGGTSPFSSVWSFTTIGDLPGQPTNLGALPSTAEASLSWRSVDGASSYIVEVYADANFTSLKWSGAPSSPSVVASNLLNGTAYYWRVRAVNEVGSGPWAASSFTTSVAPPTAPGGLSASPTTNGAVLSWGNVSEATSYVVEVHADPSFNSLKWSGTPISPTANVSGLSEGTTYYWRVKGVNVGGSSGWATSSFTTTTQPAGAPTNLRATPTETGAALSWGSVSGAISYVVEVHGDANFSNPKWSGTPTATLATAANLLSGVTYYWRARTVSSGGSSGWSTSSFTTLTPPPGSPTNLTASPATSSATMRWASVGGATSYVVEVHADVNFTSLRWSDSPVGTSALSVTLTSGTTYYWRVRAVNSSGSSGWATSTFTTSLPIPQAPTLSSPPDAAINAPRTVSLSWNAAATATSYRIQIATSASFATNVLDTANITGLGIAVTLNVNTTYYWRVSAVNASGEGAFSATRSFTVVRTTAVEGTGNSIPSEFSLGQNYPNPFNPATKIEFSLPVSSHVRITIYNALGNLVEILADQYYAPGRYVTTFEAAGFPSGVYFSRLQTPGFAATKRLMLVK